MVARERLWQWLAKFGGRNRSSGLPGFPGRCACWTRGTRGLRRGEVASPKLAKCEHPERQFVAEACLRATNIWQWEGRVNRGTYFFVGAAAFALKFLLDWAVVTQVFHRSWSLLNYWRPFGAISGIHGLTLENRLFAGVMLFLALPFIWLGLAMTVKRLRDAG